MVSDALDTVVSEEEEDEEVIDVPQPEESESAVEIPLTQLEIAKHDEELKVPDESNSESLEVIPIDKESESIDEYRLLRPSGQLAYLFAIQLGILQEIGKAVRSEDLLTYEHTVAPSLVCHSRSMCIVFSISGRILPSSPNPLSPLKATAAMACWR